MSQPTRLREKNSSDIEGTKSNINNKKVKAR
jgi:hypothetical protein